MEQTILLPKEENVRGELPFTIVNKRPTYSADEEVKNRKYVEKELYEVYRKYSNH